MKEEVVQQESAPPPAEERPAEEAPAESATAVENKADPAAPQALADDSGTAFPNGRRVSQVNETCCGGFATKSKICTVQ